MTRRQWIDLVKAELGKLDPVRNFRTGLVDGILSVVYENLVYNVYKNKPYELDDLATIEYLTVQYDSVQNKYYVQFNYTPLQIDKVGGGVIGVYVPDDESIVFVPMYLNEVKHFLRSEVSLLDGDIIYTVIGDKVYFSNLSADMNGQTLKVASVKPFDAYDMNEQVKIPSGQTNALITGAIQMLGITQPESSLNNNTDTRYGTTRTDKA